MRTIINQGDRNLVIENIIQKFKELQSRHDFVLCVGTDFLGKDPVFEFELNAEIASNLAGLPAGAKRPLQTSAASPKDWSTVWKPKASRPG